MHDSLTTGACSESTSTSSCAKRLGASRVRTGVASARGQSRVASQIDGGHASEAARLVGRTDGGGATGPQRRHVETAAVRAAPGPRRRVARRIATRIAAKQGTGSNRTESHRTDCTGSSCRTETRTSELLPQRRFDDFRGRRRLEGELKWSLRVPRRKSNQQNPLRSHILTKDPRSRSFVLFFPLFERSRLSPVR